MKKLYQYAMILLAGVLGACGSMSVNDPYVDSFPADFDVNVYSALHPQLRYLQVKDYVTSRNKEIKAAWTAQGLDAATLSANDEAAFTTNTTALASIYTTVYGGTSWATDAENTTVLNELKALNFVETTDDLTLLQAVPVNTFLISQQYIMFGMFHGWAYRYCTEAEAADVVNHPDRKTLPIYALQDSLTRAQTVAEAKNYVADKNLYCRDANGADRLIQ